MGPGPHPGGRIGSVGPTGYDARVQSFRARLGSALIAVATALAILAASTVLFLNPTWVSFEQGRSDAAAWTGFAPTDLRAATDAILSDLVIGPPDFAVQVAGQPVLDKRERAHMRDVRGVFIGFYALAALALVGGLAVWARRGSAGVAGSWRAVRFGAASLIVGLVVAGAVAAVAFDALFEMFHQLFFLGGSYDFDPATERLVQLFPFAFWQETTIVLGIVSVVLAAIVAVIADRRGREAMEALSGAGVDGVASHVVADGAGRAAR